MPPIEPSYLAIERIVGALRRLANSSFDTGSKPNPLDNTFPFRAWRAEVTSSYEALGYAPVEVRLRQDLVQGFARVSNLEGALKRGAEGRREWTATFRRLLDSVDRLPRLLSGLHLSPHDAGRLFAARLEEMYRSGKTIFAIPLLLGLSYFLSGTALTED